MLWNEVKISALQSEDMKISHINQAHHPSQHACGLTRFSRSLVFKEMQVYADVCRHFLCFFWCLQSLEGVTTGQELFCILINCLPINSSVKVCLCGVIYLARGSLLDRNICLQKTHGVTKYSWSVRSQTTCASVVQSCSISSQTFRSS